MICKHGFDVDFDICAMCSHGDESWNVDDYYDEYESSFDEEDYLISSYIDFESIAAMEFAPVGEEIEDPLD